MKRVVRTASPAFEQARMAFSLANAGSSGFGTTHASSNGATQTGPDLEEIATEVSFVHSKLPITKLNKD